MKKATTLLTALLLTTTWVFAQTSTQTEKPITQGETYSDSLASVSVHAYSVALDSAQYVFGFVNQQTVDVVVTIFNPEGDKVAEFDGPARGKESFQFDSRAAGEYRIEITPFEKKEGRYSITLKLVEAVAEDPAGRVNQLMTEYSGDDVPGAAVLVMENGEVTFQESYGMANLTYDIPMQEKTRHNIGSTSKHFLTFGLLLLQEQGQLSLDDDVRDYIPELPEFDHPVTLRNIVTHTSGYREFLNTIAMTGRNPSTDLSQEQIINIVQRQPELQNVPGAEWNYNNTGYALATEVIERVTDESFPEWMRKNVFEPIGMMHTVVRHSPAQIVENRSVGYEPAKSGGYKEVTDLGGAMGAGGIHSTMDDLAKWIQNLLEPKVGTQEMITAMTTPDTLNNGHSSGYGLGLFIQEYKGLTHYHHGGADLAHRSMLMIFPEIGGAVVTQSNFSNFNGSIPNKIADLFFEDHLKTEPEQAEEDTTGESEEFAYDVEQFDALTGRYELSVMPGFVLTFSRDGERIYTQATNQPEINLTATSDSTFSLVGVNAAITFHRNEDGSADSLTLHQNGHHTAKRISWEPAPEELANYTGRYFSDEIETVYTVALEDSSLMLQHYQMEEDLELSPGDVDSFSAGFPIADVAFVRDEEGNITGFNASNGRTRGVFFEKMEE
ncbi:serine hydrolase [Gracilimonas mengyeensis]|uniref:CubicO group peptidase, beta-lactamase class C family n=1 Tax=Gracilimonas mengyeensis TaxID=1302730 RepID=A0A521BV77_9BACT|nr:serine hydrolase [Gracilimonas mengyeensis]SMO51073.1 CubicO group peptidase, beta-lactamase class C family [Gracilimonas mengyeensis]